MPPSDDEGSRPISVRRLRSMSMTSLTAVWFDSATPLPSASRSLEPPGASKRTSSVPVARSCSASWSRPEMAAIPPAWPKLFEHERAVATPLITTKAHARMGRLLSLMWDDRPRVRAADLHNERLGRPGQDASGGAREACGWWRRCAVGASIDVGCGDDSSEKMTGENGGCAGTSAGAPWQAGRQESHLFPCSGAEGFWSASCAEQMTASGSKARCRGSTAPESRPCSAITYAAITAADLRTTKAMP